jgi:hypothetical protein
MCLNKRNASSTYVSQALRPRRVKPRKRAGAVAQHRAVVRANEVMH